jgi:ectoine hydroxylase-related dioxygenase (phytanoyl-CoA dioxygenase family)
MNTRIESIQKTNINYDLNKDGCCVFHNVLSKDEIYNLKEKCQQNNYKYIKDYLINNTKLNNLIHNSTSNDYMFQDYIWIIKKSSVHTCHRDNNGDFFNRGQKYPSYTLLIYLEDMEKCLGVIPNSHKDVNSYNFNMKNNVVNLLCNKGDIILFNANLIHVGTLNQKDDNLRIQMKVSHKDDIEVLSYYENYNKVLNEDNKLPLSIRKIQKNFSCMFPIISNLTQKENIQSSRGTVNGANISIFQKIFSYLFYGNSNFYDLPNAF